MNREESKHSQIRNADPTSEGLRVLARIIARRLMERKSGLDGHDPFDCGGPLLPDATKSEEAGNGEDKSTSGRPRLFVDFAIVLRLRDEQNLGWSKMAEVYRDLTGQYVSRDTIKRRYLEAKLRSHLDKTP